MRSNSPPPGSPDDRAPKAATPSFLSHGGEAGRLIQSRDWSRTSLGPLDRWPESLRTTLSLILSSRQPMFLLWGPDLLLFYNDAYTPSLGSGKHPAALGQGAYECWPEGRSLLEPEIRAVMEGGESIWNREQRGPIFREGKLQEVYWTYGYSPIRLPDGTVGGLLAICSETTERVAADRRVQGEAEKHAQLLRFMPTAFFSVSRHWVLDYMNPAAEEVLGIPSAEVVEKSLWDAFPGLRGSRFGEGYRRAMEEGVRTVTEDYYPDFDRWYEAWAYPIEQGLAICFFDVTERKASELALNSEKQKLEAIFYGSASPLVFFRGPELVYEIFNAKYEQLVPKRELLGKPLLKALPELEGTAFPALIQKVFETGEPVRTHEELAPLANPVTGELEERFFDSGISRVLDGEGKPSGVFVQATEVTERVLARKKIEQALSARDTFLSIASHELRTPITSLKLQTQLMKRSLARNDPGAVSHERVTKLVEQADEGLTRMARLVEDMLDISRIQSGKLSFHRECTEFVSLVKGVVDRFMEQLAGAGVPVFLEAGAPELYVSVDRFRMEQVLTNLITNAVRYAPGAPLRISLALDGDLLRLIFHDGGPGIAQEHLERIFERFERLVSASDVSGLGLGLFIVRQIVQAHGGEIHAESGPAPGARFVMALPGGSAVPFNA